MRHDRIYKGIMYLLMIISLVYIVLFHDFIPDKAVSETSFYLALFATTLIHLYGVKLGNFPSIIFSTYAEDKIHPLALHLFGFALLLFNAHVTTTYALPSAITSMQDEETTKTFLVEKKNRSSRMSCSNRFEFLGHYFLFTHVCASGQMFSRFPETAAMLAFDTKTSVFGSQIQSIAIHPGFRPPAN